MSLIDNTYFINDINLVGSQLTNIQQYIDIYEPEILKSLLGYELYKALLADLNEAGNPQSDRFINLINGAEFTITDGGNTITEKWEGLVNTKKQSLISYHVYFNYRQINENVNTGVGQKNIIAENSENASYVEMMVGINNKMIDLYGNTGINRIINYNNANYGYYNYLPSAYNFLLSNIDDYPEWIFKPIEKINVFGI